MGTKIRKWMFQAAFAVVISVASAASAAVDTAKVQYVVNVASTIKVVVPGGETVSKAAQANVERTVAVPLPASSSPADGDGDRTGVAYGAQRSLDASALVRSRNGSVAIRLSPKSYQNAEVSLHSVNGKRVMYGKTSATAEKSIAASGYLTAGVYLLSVKGADKNSFASRIAHRGGSLDINVAFLNDGVSPTNKLTKALADATVSVTVSAADYEDSTYSLGVVKGTDNPKQTITLRKKAVTPPVDPPVTPPVDTPKADFKETVGSVSFDMVYIPGGTFTLGCESGSKCQAGAAKPVEGVKMNSYWIMKNEASSALWKAVMGVSHAGGTWYEAVEFACELSKKTGRKYHLMTEAEFEYAAKKYKDKLANIGGSGMTGEEWAYNSWDADKHMGGTDPVGPSSGQHTQKTRRDADSEGSDRVTSRLIRSIDGIGPATRLVVSADMDYPKDYVPSCDIHPPVLSGEPTNSYRDPRWITGDSNKWGTGSIAIGSFDLQVWEDGTAKLGSTTGQWFTSNNVAFVFVPSSGTPVKYAYIFLDDKQGSVIGEGAFGSSGGYIGRYEKKSSSATKPTVSGLKSGEELAKAQTAKFDSEYKMVDMTNLPKKASDITSAYKQDNRLLDGGVGKGWFQDNTSMKKTLHPRNRFYLDESEFKKFKIEDGNIVWGENWDLIFPVEQLYSGAID